MSHPDIATFDGTSPSVTGDWSGTCDAWGATGAAQPDALVPQIMLICEHASNATAPPWAQFDDAPAQMSAHVASDPGALGLARALGENLGRATGAAELVHAPLSRLIYDLNRSPERMDAMPSVSETFHITQNQGLDTAQRMARMQALYLPFHNHVRARIARALLLGTRPCIVTIHSFTPTWYGQPRDVEFGIIHDDAPEFAQAILAHSPDTGLTTRLNEPYSAADHVTHTLRLHALPYFLPNAMLELRNDLIASAAQQTDIAARLAPAILRAMQNVKDGPCPQP
ncbi:N-formylglutamate amidohydrolase [Roseinatronobacter alkalisoli]|uniref:N-formylglutamate amidohydrolase n=1 Tax=Roseinatronobacter alkalisoli TaxID=3028235 RepID=A0ABT5T7L3_9RHOB|nr:N-formylglutamate amidohydrolase [Roseinatronobacter sp. HJB301]MDD7971115.1 N-formylglutamate amidohydrolase [Roseinatronobacter sp. HJB301]